METWFITILSLCIATLIITITITFHRKKNLPPGPPFLSTIFLLLTNSPINLEPILINLKTRYGPIFTLSSGLQTNIIVADHSLAHKILVQKGAVFSDRPKSIPVRNIATCAYGPTWRLFRRNLAVEIMHPARIRSYSWARKWVLRILVDRLQERQESEGIKVVDHFQYAMFCLLVFMCFGEKFEESKINEIVRVQRNFLIKLGSGRFTVLSVFPRFRKILFRNRWKV